MDFPEVLRTLQPVFWLVFAISAIGAMLITGHLKRWVSSQIQNAKIKARSVLTPNEQEFFGRLKRALPDYDVLAQVSMGALLTTTVSKDHPEFWKLRKRFAQKISDFVVMRKGATGPEAVVAVVELDDRTHDKHKDAKRDEMLASAGIRTLRFESRAKPSEAEIRRQIKALDPS